MVNRFLLESVVSASLERSPPLWVRLEQERQHSSIFSHERTSVDKFMATFTSTARRSTIMITRMSLGLLIRRTPCSLPLPFMRPFSTVLYFDFLATWAVLPKNNVWLRLKRNSAFIIFAI